MSATDHPAPRDTDIPTTSDALSQQLTHTTTLDALTTALGQIRILHRAAHPAGLDDSYRQAEIHHALGEIGGALLATRHTPNHTPNLARLRYGLAALAATALAWLDTLPLPSPDNSPGDDDYDDPDDAFVSVTTGASDDTCPG